MEKRLGRWIFNDLWVVFFALLYVCGAGCESGFEPLQENDRYVFSMYGSLDLHADTQWVRVMPIAESLLLRDPEPDGTQVTLIDLSSGEETHMQPKLFRFNNNVYVWNYWTTKQLKPNEAYMVRAETPDGMQSYATLSTPSVLPVPEIIFLEESEKGTIKGSSEDPLVTVEIRYLVQALDENGCAPEREIILSYIDAAGLNLNGEYHIQFDNSVRLPQELGVSASEYRVNRRELIVISASEDWPDIADLNEKEITLPDVVSNVHDGTGFIAGIAGRKIEFTPRRKPC